MSQRIWKGKKAVLCVVVLILALSAVASGVYFRALPLAQESDTIHRVELGGREVTEQVDERALLELLALAEYRRTLFPQGGFYYKVTDDLVVISLHREQGTQIFLSPRSQTAYCGHISIDGTLHVWKNPILEGEQLYRQVMDLLEAGTT